MTKMRNFGSASFVSIYRNAKQSIIFPLYSSRRQLIFNTNLQLWLHKRQFSNLPSSVTKLIFDDGGRKQIAEEFPNPKNIFQKVISEAFLVNQSLDLNSDIKFEQVISGGSGHGLWKATLSLMWPVKFTVEATGAKKVEAEKLVYSLACKKFKEFGVLDSENLPVLPKSELILNDSKLNQSKSRLGNIYQVIWPRVGKRDVIPMYSTSEVTGLFGNKYWKSELRLKYPAAVNFEGVGKRLTLAENVAAAKALRWLYEKGVINKKLEPVLFSKEEEKEMFNNQKAPYPIIIPENLQVEMKETLQLFKGLEAHFDEMNKSGIEECFQNAKVSVLCDDFSGSENENDHVFDCSEIVSEKNFLERDIITEKPLRDLSEEEMRTRNQTMFDKYTEWQMQSDPKALKILNNQKELPIFKKKEEILKLVSENQVVVLSGETGSGKTTQVPQYILDSYIKEMRGSDCNIIITQPRRISAISIAARVAAERGEKVGETVGHQVRFDKNLPEEKGALLFCSTGILLRKLCLNPSLDGISHIIVDEVHERNVQIDFLLILLKNLLKSNKNIKVILMSATFNYEIFSQYFDGCHIVNVPGFIYPVKQLFLDDIAKSMEHQDDDFFEPKLNSDLIANTVKHIHKSQPPGAILCFLPGWNEIKDVGNKLHSELSDGSDYVIYPAHSRLSHDKQKRIFNRPPDGVRKIILATNIAETSITINDVVYVVDSGFQKETSFCARKGTAALGTQWISKANVLQRKGRAGRVKPGVCYHLYPKKVFDSMEDYPTPEILRMPLENVILDCKLYCPDMTAEDFLSLAVQPPPRNSIQHGVKELQMLEILDENENLTVLGKSIVNFTSHPRLSKALVLGAFLRCLDPILTTCAFLTLSRDVFLNTLEDNEERRKVKEDYDHGMCSDHMAMYNMYSSWPGSRSEGEIMSDFAAEHQLDEDSLIFVKRLKELFAEHLFDAGLIDDKYSFTNPEAKCNQNSGNMNIVYSALCSAFHPNTIKLTQGEKRRGRLRKDAVICSTVRGLKAHISKESVAYQQHQLPSPWLIYFSALQSDARMALLAQDVSLVAGLCLLLFAGQHLCIIQSELHQSTEDQEPNLVVLKVDDFAKLSFYCSPSEGELLNEWRICVRQILNLQLRSPNTSSSWLSLFHEKYIPTLKKVLCTDQAPFIQGKKFYLENNSLITEDLD